MESLKQSLVTRKWFLCTCASFISGLVLLFLCTNESQRTGSIGGGGASDFFLLANNFNVNQSSNATLSFTSPSNLAISPQLFISNMKEEGLVSPQTHIALPPQSSKDTMPLDAKQEVHCDIFEGRWVYDKKKYPLYHAHRCPFLSDQVNCRRNGRPDSGYEHWRWEPRGCEIPRFNGSDMLERLRGKRVVIVGDSLNRNQWESLSCLLYTSVRPSRVLVKAQGSDHKIFRALDYGCSVEFFWSPFLVKLEEMKGDDKKVLKLDKLHGTEKRWRGANILVFNTGHWWTHSGKKWDYFEKKGKLVEEMERDTAFKTAVRAWAKWVDRVVDSTKTTVFFRSISPEHKRQHKQWCYNQTTPITNETYIQLFPRSMVRIVERTIQKMKTPVKYLNITRLSEYRRDAHTVIYTSKQGKVLTFDQQMQPEKFADCSHWCLPGLPDTWNVLIYASIVGLN
ncbi:protein trichome birefringence-like 28 [Dioscorea cayenensis subsp. rotundata]|uniref:Protein trichome birefringence-like 28 n=1 Tax=Dioscorea cayennensis subsp. rotundata TaxID=55577 RepID=A0AB40AZI6_DIOCR|nr:protein trichome birefringence-like 28 [Dioscorea cayenensis subsp. rotundata]